MSLPTVADLKALDYAYMDGPFCYVAAKATVTLAGMDVYYLDTPFVANEDAAVSSNIKKALGVAYASIKKINGVAIASVKEYLGVA
jgi:hypothetical protein